jgi:hypothetical protein
MKSKNTAKANAQTQQNCNTCQRQKSEHCAKCHGFNNFGKNAHANNQVIEVALTV